jgi:hypothetical protein
MRYNRIIKINLKGASINKHLIGVAQMEVKNNMQNIVENAKNIAANVNRIESNREDIRENADRIAQNAELIEVNKELIATNKKLIEELIDSVHKIKEQQFLYEANLSRQNGFWVLEHEGERKYFTPGKITKVESKNSDETVEFKYEEGMVVCSMRKGQKLVSKHVFTAGGAPVSGQIYNGGRVVREFQYNELGQVANVK